MTIALKMNQNLNCNLTSNRLEELTDVILGLWVRIYSAEL